MMIHRWILPPTEQRKARGRSRDHTTWSGLLESSDSRFWMLIKGDAAAPPLRSTLATLRPIHWSKNLLLFVPLILAHEALNMERLAAVALAFVAFSLCASAGYLFNDLRDLTADRQHPIKRRRPLAAETIPLAWAPPLAVGLLIGGFGLSLTMLPAGVSAVLAVYVAGVGAYSLVVKRIAVADVVLLAGFYTLRVVAGASRRACRCRVGLMKTP